MGGGEGEELTVVVVVDDSFSASQGHAMPACHWGVRSDLEGMGMGGGGGGRRRGVEIGELAILLLEEIRPQLNKYSSAFLLFYFLNFFLVKITGKIGDCFRPCNGWPPTVREV